MKSRTTRSIGPAFRQALLFFVFVALFATGPKAGALDPHKSVAQYAHEVWTVKDGLPEADILAILQTSDGYVWVGTEEGLARFDGAHFIVFDRKTAGLPDNRIQALAETPDGSLWIGTENGLTRFKEHHFTNYSTRDGLPSNDILALKAEPGGPLWITTVGGPRLWKNESFERDPAIEQIAGTWPSKVLRASSGDTWVLGDKGLSVLHNGAARILENSAPLARKGVTTLLMDESADVLWVGSASGLYRVAKGRLLPYLLSPEASHPDINALLEDRDHNLWVGTVGEGLFRVSGEGVLHYSVPDGLSAVEVKSLYEDRTGNLWVGTFGGGLEVFRDSMFTPYGKPEGMERTVAWTVMEDRDSSIWVGTQSGGLTRIKDGKLTHFSTRRGFADDTVGSLLEGKDGTLWLGKDTGVSRFRQGRLLGAPPLSSPLREQIHAMYEDANGTLWLGTRNAGVVLIRGSKSSHLTTADGLPSDNVQTIVPSKRGGIWIGTLGGLSYYKDGSLTNLTSKEGLSGNQVLSLYEDGEGALWIGAIGLNRLKDGKVTAFGDREGLFDQNPQSILEDDEGNLWLSTNKGVFRVSKKQLNDFAEGKAERLMPVAFGVADGMRSSECNGGSAPAGWKDGKGNLWFATVAGVVKLDPRASANSQRLELHVEDLWADSKHFDPSDPVELPAGGHDLEVHYSAPYFGGGDRLRYKYKLEGFDGNWVDAGKRSVAYYTNLPPGRYQFRVQAASNDGVWISKEAGVNLQIRPLIYQTWWFRLAVLTAGLGSVYLFVIARTAYLNKLRLQLEEQVAEHMAARQQAHNLESLGQIAGGVAHDFNNMLGIIMGHTERLISTKPSPQVERSLNIIFDTCKRGAALTQQLLAFGRKQILRPAAIDLNRIVAEVKGMMSPVIGEDIDLICTFDGLSAVIMADRSQIERVLVNLVINARDAMPHGGRVEVEVKRAAKEDSSFLPASSTRSSQHVRIRVTDTGTGMDAETLTHIFEPFFTTKKRGQGSGLGLAQVYGTVQQSGGSISVQSALGCGTQFAVYFPLVADQVSEAKPLSTPVPRGNETVLVVEDQLELLEITAAIVRNLGYEVLEANSPAQAIEMAKALSGRLDLLLTDVKMPGMNGRQLADELLKRRPSLNVIFMTGYSESSVLGEDMLNRNIPILHKPFTQEQLGAMLRQVLQKSGPA